MVKWFVQKPLQHVVKLQDKCEYVSAIHFLDYHHLRLLCRKPEDRYPEGRNTEDRNPWKKKTGI